MAVASYSVTAPLWLHPGEAGWHFVTLPADVADEIRARFDDAHRPFGSLPVRVSLGTSSWSTSLFRDSKSASYLIPVKADVRRRQRINAGDTVTLLIKLSA